MKEVYRVNHMPVFGQGRISLAYRISEISFRVKFINGIKEILAEDLTFFGKPKLLSINF